MNNDPRRTAMGRLGDDSPFLIERGEMVVIIVKKDVLPSITYMGQVKEISDSAVRLKLVMPHSKEFGTFTSTNNAEIGIEMVIPTSIIMSVLCYGFNESDAAILVEETEGFIECT